MQLIEETRRLQEDLQSADVEETSREEAESLVDRLRSVIRQHDHRYYVDDDPLISDQEYDRLYRRLQSLEQAFPDLKSPDSPTQRVGGEPIDSFDKHEHPEPLLSLQNAFDAEELRAWYDRCRRGLADRFGDVRPSLVAELKIDGLALALTYEDGTLEVAATRGDGNVGENVTHNIRTVHRIPLRIPVGGTNGRRIPDRIEIRGEVFMRKSEFEQLNERLVENGQDPFSNPRNAAAGTLRQLDPSVVAQRPLSFFAFATGPVSGLAPATHTEALALLEDLGLPMEEHTQQFDDLDALVAYCEGWVENRDTLDYEVDGVVVKIDRHDFRDHLGTIADAPRWAVAYKFPAREATTTLRDIVVNVGRTGRVNPEAKLEPVEVGGVTVSQATLHNEDYVRDRDIRVGDTVVVKRAGDVIPQVVRPVSDARTGAEQVWSFPETCPACGTDLVRPPDEAAHFCPNSECPEQFKRLVEHFVQRGAMDVEGLGERLCHRLVDLGLISSLADIFRLEMDDLVPLEGFGEKSATNLLNAIEDAKERSLSRFLYALGIPHVGKTVAETIVKHVPSVRALADCERSDLLAIEGIGPTIAESVVHWFDVETNRDLVASLLEAGVNGERLPHEAPEPESEDLPLAGQTIVITGSLPDYTRGEAKEAVKQAGGTVTSSVSGNTDVLLLGENPGSKLDDAREEGTHVLEIRAPEQFRAFVRGEQST